VNARAADVGALIRAVRTPLADLALAAAVVAAVTLVLFPIQELDPGVSSGVLYVLGVLLLAIYRGLWIGLVASVASALALDFFHAEPVGRFDAKSAGDFVAIGVLLLTATIASFVADRARARIELREVQASRARVIAAADAERRRVVRDLHDGAQQRLVHTVVTLKLARGALERDDGEAIALVDEALANAQQATNELRELAHGILPSVLTHGGLRAAADALASRMPVPVELDIARTRLPANVEATAYFVLAEALTNVAKHAGASHATVTATVGGGWVKMEVRDDGAGGARPDGWGLLGMHDRLSALGGRLGVESPHGGGTLITAEIPVAG
jgi:signal transduction histidine kinase